VANSREYNSESCGFIKFSDFFLAKRPLEFSDRSLFHVVTCINHAACRGF
jgi:hypothetical protein